MPSADTESGAGGGSGPLDETTRGQALVGTSGFAYREWAPRFYPAEVRGDALLRHYAGRLRAVELNSTFYRQPSASAIAGWLAATPGGFRFCPKAQRGAAFRALRSEPIPTVAWLTAPYRAFGERIGCVLLRVGDETPRSDVALSRLLAAWPADLRLALELRHASWADDEVHALLRAHGATLVATDRDEEVEPDLRVTGSFLYLRLRRRAYAEADLQRWAERLAPFLADGLDAYVFLRHDAAGDMALAAERLAGLLSLPDRPVGRISDAP